MYQQEKKPYLNVNYIFGVASKDTSDHLRVDDLGYIAYDEAFDFYEEKSQLWFEQFCSVLETKMIFSTQHDPFVKFVTNTDKIRNDLQVSKGLN